MSNRQVVDLYGLLPALYRLEDAEQGYPLQALLEAVAEQADIIKRDIDGLWDDYFIETCGDWVVPYIGDLVANNPLYEVDQRRRPDVARTISYRRRKGTLPMLEELARHVTGWGTHAVAFFELLGWTQNLNHLRYEMTRDSEGRNPDAVDRVGTVNLRNVDALDRLDGPFDVISHTVDVRTIRRTEGWYNVRKVGFFLWRLHRYAIRGVTPRQAASPHVYGYHFSPLGNPAPLFTEPQPEMGETDLGGEINVPGPIRPIAFHLTPNDYYGPDRSLSIIKDGDPVRLPAIVCKDLCDWDRPPAGTVAVDVRLGRLAFANGEEPEKTVEVSYNYGFSADTGGGPYRRRRPRPQPGQPARSSPDTVASPDALGVLIRVPTDVATIHDALTKWKDQMGQPRAVIQINNGHTYQTNLSIDMAGTELVIQAADRQRPTLIGDVIVVGGTDEGRLTLNGLLIEGSIEVRGSLGELSIEHCTLVPGRSLDEEGEPREPAEPSVTVQPPNQRLRLQISHSIVGPLRVPTNMVSLEVNDSIIDSPLRGGRAESVPALVSELRSSVTLSSNNPTVRVAIGDEGPYTAVLPEGKPKLTGERKTYSVFQAGKLLQEAIRTAHRSPTFENARVFTIPYDLKRLIVMPGVAESVTITAAEADFAASELGVDLASGHQVYALVSGRLPRSIGLSSDVPALKVTIGDEGPHEAELPVSQNEKEVSISRARELLQEAIQRAHPSPAFKNALVGYLVDRLVVLPGSEGMAVRFGAMSDDQKTVTDLALESDRPAIAASDGGELAGPPTTLERTTVFGAVHVRELTLASEVIFTAPVTTVRRQAGSVRFSYVPEHSLEHSLTPRRYRCQPDLALMQLAEETHRKSVDNLPDVEKDLVYARLRPAFTSFRYGDAAYAQLDLTSAKELRTGAEDGSEMGAFNHLMQPQREANLRLRLEEYLPFGLEAGLIYVT
jgi:hypothetical protein